jgi:hypothetical protein
MILARLRRFAWLLILVLVIGLGTPMLASAAPCDATPAAVTHRRADGVVHSHAGHEGVDKAADRDPGSPRTVPGV